MTRSPLRAPVPSCGCPCHEKPGHLRMRWMTYQEAADALGLGIRTVYEIVETHKLPRVLRRSYSAANGKRRRWTHRVWLPPQTFRALEERQRDLRTGISRYLGDGKAETAQLDKEITGFKLRGKARRGDWSSLEKNSTDAEEESGHKK